MKCTASRLTLNGLPFNKHMTHLKANHINRALSGSKENIMP